MPDQTYTPASRRFLPPSSAPRSQISTNASRKVTFGNPQQTTSSSPFLRTPLQKQHIYKDEIETSFEDSLELPPSGANRENDGGSSDINVDYIVDGNALSSTPVMKARPQDADVIDPGHSSDDNVDETSHAHTANFSSPLPKRQKISHHRRTSKDRVSISSSVSAASGDELDSPHVEATDENEVVGDLTDDQIEHEDIRDNLEEPSARSKFRVRRAVFDDVKPEIDRTNVRGAFKALSEYTTPWLETPLPATFSPSRRKGKNDYMYGGAAETVRGWILDIANEQVKGAGSEDHEHRVTAVSEDSSGRFDIVKDGQNQTWMLVRQDHQNERLQHKSEDGQQKSMSFVTKGAGTSWLLNASAPVDERQTSDKIQVSVLWESKS